MGLMKSAGLFVATALAEITGCYLAFLWLRRAWSPFLLVPAAVALGAFAWLLTLHGTAAARTYAAYGGVYVSTAIVWLWLVEGQRPTRTDVIGALVALAGMVIIVAGHAGDVPSAPAPGVARPDAERR